MLGIFAQSFRIATRTDPRREIDAREHRPAVGRGFWADPRLGLMAEDRHRWYRR